MHETLSVRERVGAGLGWLSAPMFGAIALARHARVFHPDGIVVSARATAIATAPELQLIAARLAGFAIVRFSSALWREGKEWPDAVGCAIRFCESLRASTEPEASDQDLLFATIRTPVATPLGPFGTDVHDFLGNVYFATAPFDVPGIGRAKLRLVPEVSAPPGRDRGTRLADAIMKGQGSLRIEMRRTWHRGYAAVARLALLSVEDVEQDHLRFSPFRTGRGVVPRGFVHALRRGAYAASQNLGHPRASAAR